MGISIISFLVQGRFLFNIISSIISRVYAQGIVIKTPVQWPVTKGFSFTCWLRVESFPQNGTMGLFSFLTENGRGCYAVLAMDKLIYEVKLRNCILPYSNHSSIISMIMDSSSCT